MSKILRIQDPPINKIIIEGLFYTEEKNYIRIYDSIEQFEKKMNKYFKYNNILTDDIITFYYKNKKHVYIKKIYYEKSN